MRNRDIRTGVVLMIIFLVLYGVSFTFPKSTMTHTSAAFFPRIVLIVGMGLTCILIIRNLLQEKTSSSNKRIERGQKLRVIGSMGMAVLLLGFGSVFIGTFVSIFVLIVAIMVLWGVRNKITILLTATLTPILVYVIFTKILLVQFPSGFLF